MKRQYEIEYRNEKRKWEVEQKLVDMNKVDEEQKMEYRSEQKM